MEEVESGKPGDLPLSGTEPSRESLVLQALASFDLSPLRELCAAFHRMSGIPLGLVDREGRILIAEGWQPICVRYHRASPSSLALCDAVLARALSGKEKPLQGSPLVEYRCGNGMVDLTLDLEVAGLRWAVLILGQFLYRDEAVDEATFRARDRAAGWDEAAYLAELRAVPRLPRDRVLEAASAFVALGRLIADHASGLMRASAAAEEHRRAEERLARALAERDTLLVELQHRFKNNFALVSSLLSLEAGETRDAGARATIAEVQSRVRSLSLLYERLGGSAAGSRVELATYLADMRATLSSALAREGCVLELLGVESLSLDAARAGYVGLVVDELVVNAFKHAFAGRAAGRVLVGAVRRGGDCLVRVLDDGVGLPPGYSLEGCRGLGRRILGLLAAQLGGRLEIASPAPELPPGSPGPGSSFTLVFPV